ncbi:hypothetical protein C7S16_3187 [Burkholderia thailandensis]|uniref:Uncharacterized protein n=1 Tax=Burkholderia thailandensis TaxID=57975 RepID=A0AAW9D5Y6_BURTH|nr:hypothetical protein [Burkholderia thailandensis]MDW9257294.1 hypothetical protein [Burkholderia thailandensis]
MIRGPDNPYIIHSKIGGRIPLNRNAPVFVSFDDSNAE